MEKDRSGSDYKVITSLQFKNQSRNKTNEGGLPMAGPGVVAGGQVVHSNSREALSGSTSAAASPAAGTIQQAQPQPQIQQQQLHQQQSSYDDHYDSYGDSKMPRDAKFPYNPPANATIQSVEIGQTDIPKYQPPQPQEQAQRPSKDCQQPLPAGLSATSNVAALNAAAQQQYQLLFIIP
ncbi:hypothetical protein quinque_002726 [Culex quinquefasciatus]